MSQPITGRTWRRRLPQSDGRHRAGQEAKGLSQGQIVRKRFFGHTGAVVGSSSSPSSSSWPSRRSGSGRDPRLVEVQPRRGRPAGQRRRARPLRCGRSPGANTRSARTAIGRDLFAMTMRGTQQSIIIMLVIGLIAGLVGVVVGAVSGLLPRPDRGRADALHRRHHHHSGAPARRRAGQWPAGGLRRLVQPSPAHRPALGIFLGLVIWTGLARLVRGEFLTPARTRVRRRGPDRRAPATAGSSSSTSCPTRSA